MKIRNGFVTNSSSSSFIVKKSKLTDEEWEIIKGYTDQRKHDDDSWDFYELSDIYVGETIIDNGELESYLNKHNMSLESFEIHEWIPSKILSRLRYETKYKELF